MNLVYDRWKVTALTHKEKILNDFQKKYREYKTFIPDLKTSSLVEQQKTLKPIFQDYDSLRPDEGVFKSVEDFLSRPFYYLSIYEKVKTFQMLKKEFPYSWLKHYNTWEKRETAHLRMQNCLPGINIVDSLSSIVGFDFFSGADLKNYERMPSDFAYLNIKNALVSSQITRQITRIRSHMLGRISVPEKKLSLPLKEAILFSQLEEICRSNEEFSMKDTKMAGLRLPELIFIDGVSLPKKYPALKEGELPRILYKDLISENRQVHVAVSQYMPSTSHYRVKLFLLELTDISEEPCIQALPESKRNNIIKAVEIKNLKDRLGQKEKMEIEFALARKMEDARGDYEAFYQKHWNYEGHAQLQKRMEIFLKKVLPDPYFQALEEFYHEASAQFNRLLEPYSSHISTRDFSKLYLFYTDEYGKLKSGECKEALNALMLGSHSQYLPVLNSMFEDIMSSDISSYAFFTPEQLFENLDWYFPLYHKTILFEKLALLFPDFLAALEQSPDRAVALSERFSYCLTFYSYALRLSKVFGFSFETAKSLPHGLSLSYENMFQDEILAYFRNWLMNRLHTLSHMENPPLSTGYGFPICLSELDLARLFEMVIANVGWIAAVDPKTAADLRPGRFFYIDGEPVRKFTGFDQVSEIAKSISGGRHILDVPCFYLDSKSRFQVVFLRLYDRTGVLPDDNARKKHTPQAAAETGKRLSEEMNRCCRDCIKKQAESISKYEEKTEKRHHEALLAFENDIKVCQKLKEQLDGEKKNLGLKREELKKLRTLPPPPKLPARKRILNRFGFYKKTAKKYEAAAEKRKADLDKLEKEIMDCKNSINSHQQYLETALRAKEVLGAYEKMKDS